jgi:prepilin-type N-terminal cleavage/methylation domain-containing protein
VNINLRREEGFTLTEMMVAMAVMLIVVGGALTTFQNAMQVNDSASQLADANQNLRAGTNQLIRDLMMAGRIIGAEGVSMPSGAGVRRSGAPPPREPR